MAWKEDAKGVILVIVGVIAASVVVGWGGQFIAKAKGGAQ